VLAGLGLLIWTNKLLIPRLLTRPISLVAASSLYIYLIHWQIYSLGSTASPLLALAVCLASGVAVWVAVTSAQRELVCRFGARSLPAQDEDRQAPAGKRPSLMASINSR